MKNNKKGSIEKKPWVTALFIMGLMLFSHLMMGSFLERRPSHEIKNFQKSILWNSLTGTSTDIVATISTHLVAICDGNVQGTRFDTTLDMDENLDIILQSPEPGQGTVIVLWEVEGDLGGKVDFYLNPDYTINCELTPLNYFIGEAVDGNAEICLAESVTDLVNWLPFGGKFGNTKKAGGPSSANEIFLAKNGDDVLIRVHSDGNNNNISLKVWWKVVPTSQIL
jgi:hypothetical protein